MTEANEMSTPIDHTGRAKVASPPRVNAVKPAPSSTDMSSASTASNSGASEDTVHLTGDAVQMQELSATVAKAPVVDMKKVSDIRQAISNGSYVVDSKATARKMIASNSGLSAY